MRRLFDALFAFGFAGSTFLACSADDASAPAPKRATKSSHAETQGDDDDAPAPTTTATTTNDPPPVEHVDAGDGTAATTYVGKLDTTVTVPFGGTPYCKYTVTLKSVEIEVAALPNGTVIGAEARDTMIEATVPPCSNSPAPPSARAFTFTTYTATGADTAQIAFSGAATNHPATKLLIDLKKVGGAYEASVSWHRTDQSAPLDWTVTTKITLGPR